MRRPLRGLLSCVAMALMLLVGTVAGSRAATPGDFDFYVLSLSWSPTYCADHADDRTQCGGRPFGFVVHGLWPQYERGYPRGCDGDRDALPRSVVDSMLDIMPSPSLVRHEWQTHGLCSGLDATSYFALVRQARQAVTVPPGYAAIRDYRTVSAREVENAFLAANRGLGAGGIAVACHSRQLEEVRLCLTKDLRFRDCPEVDRAQCRQPKLVMPPVR